MARIDAFPRVMQKYGADFVHDAPDAARFRINVFRKHPGPGAAFRSIPHATRTLDVGLPPALERMLESRSGLILVNGAANSGQSTRLAAMADHRNNSKDYHILTLRERVRPAVPAQGRPSAAVKQGA